MAFLSENLGTIIAILALALCVFLIIKKLIKDKKKGKCSCGFACSNCKMAGSCHINMKEKEE